MANFSCYRPLSVTYLRSAKRDEREERGKKRRKKEKKRKRKVYFINYVTQSCHYRPEGAIYICEILCITKSNIIFRTFPIFSLDSRPMRCLEPNCFVIPVAKFASLDCFVHHFSYPLIISSTDSVTAAEHFGDEDHDGTNHH